jgi:hypothetical protein
VVCILGACEWHAHARNPLRQIRRQCLVDALLLCRLGLWLWCDRSNPLVGGCLCGLFSSQSSLSLLDGSSHVSICPTAWLVSCNISKDDKGFYSLFIDADIFSDLVMDL